MVKTLVIQKKKSVRPLPVINRKDTVMQGCYLCGSEMTIPTVEHVFANSLFSPYRLEMPIKLMACMAHNQSKRRDDEYSSLLIQATSVESKESREAFRKSVGIIEKKYKEHGTITKDTPGIGLIMGLRKNARPISYIKRNGVLVRFNGAIVDINSQRFTNFLQTIAKGLLVASTKKLYDWNKYEISSEFDHTTMSDRPKPLYPIFEMITKNCQYAECWGDVLFVAGSTSLSPEGKLVSIQTVLFFNSHVGIVKFVER